MSVSHVELVELVGNKYLRQPFCVWQAENKSGVRAHAKRGVLGLGKGIFDGVTGIVTKPMEGAMHGGVKGFGKGLAQVRWNILPNVAWNDPSAHGNMA